VARVLRMNEQDWAALWNFARRESPPFPLHPQTGMVVHGAWQQAVNAIDAMAYVTDASWNVLAHNPAWIEMFPSRRTPANTMRWMALDPEARQVLGQWEDYWAPLLLPQLRSAIAVNPTNETLCRLEQDVLADPVAGPLYEGAASQSRLHPDGDERPLNHPSKGPGWVTMCTAEPLTARGAQLMILLFNMERQVSADAPMLRALA
jgi:hypothetical protein